jgi:predicted acetyltransferase
MLAHVAETDGRDRATACDDAAMDGIEIRITAPEEYRAASATVSTALMHAPSNDETWEKAHRIASWEQSDSLSAWDGDRCVGHVAGSRFDTLVPGGAWVPMSGVTRVGVLASHRRRGLMRALLVRLLTDAAERGQVLAGLRASETRIYQRFGFGLAGSSAEVTMTSRDALPITGIAPGSMRILRADEIVDTVVPIYERSARRPGVLARPDWMWQRFLEKAIELGGDAEFVAVHAAPDGTDDGFVHYSVKWVEARATPPRGTGEIYDLWGVTPGAELALWEFICNIDLVDEWFAEERPTDDIVQLAVADTRAYRTKWIFDEQWLRVLDVDAALTARQFADVDGSVSIGIADSMLPANNGVWNVAAAGAKRIGDDVPADIAVDIRELSAAYLGGTRWSSLAAAGRVDVRNPAAVVLADALFAVPEAPYSCSGF